MTPSSPPLKNILIGFDNISSQMEIYKEGFSALGLNCVTAIDVFSHARGQNIDYVMEGEKFTGDMYRSKQFAVIFEHLHTAEGRSFLWEKALRDCDAFMFHWRSFNPDYSDLAELKARGKKIICVFNGDDVRWMPAMEQEFDLHRLHPIPYEPIHYQVITCEGQAKKLRLVERYADLIIANPNTMQLALRPYLSHRIPIPLHRLQPSSDATALQRRECPVIVHAPTAPLSKGTPIVLQAIRRLRWEGIPHKFVLLENIPYYEVLERYRDADIMIDQLYAPGGGKVCLELLALNKVVVTNHSRHYFQPHSDGAPFVDVTVDTLYDQLKSIILDYPRRCDLARRGRAFVETNHEPSNVCRSIVHHLMNPDEPVDVRPSFFRHHYRPHDDSERAVLNGLTDSLRESAWYRKEIPPGSREGLVF